MKTVLRDRYMLVSFTITVGKLRPERFQKSEIEVSRKLTFHVLWKKLKGYNFFNSKSWRTLKYLLRGMQRWFTCETASLRRLPAQTTAKHYLQRILISLALSPAAVPKFHKSVWLHFHGSLSEKCQEWGISSNVSRPQNWVLCLTTLVFG